MMSRFEALMGRLKETVKVEMPDGSTQEIMLRFTKVKYFAELLPFINKEKDGNAETQDLTKEELISITGIVREMIVESNKDITPEEAEVLIISNLSGFIMAFSNIIKRAVGFMSKTSDAPKNLIPASPEVKV